MMTPVPQTDADRKQMLNAFLQKSQSRRVELQSALKERAKERRSEAETQKQWGQKQIAEEYKKELKTKAALIQFKKNQAEQKLAIANMLAQKKAEADRLEAKKAAEKEYNDRKKAYMKSMHDQTTIGMLQDKRVEIAKHTKLDIIQAAEHEYKKELFEIDTEQKEQMTTVHTGARNKRSIQDTIETEEIHTVTLHSTEEIAKIRSKEGQALSLLEAEHERQKMRIPIMLRTIPTSAPMQKLKHEWEQKKRAHDLLFQKQLTAVEIHRRNTIAQIKQRSSKIKNSITLSERETIQALQVARWQKRASAERAYIQKRHEAMQEEQRIIHLSLEEALALEGNATPDIPTP
jgi:hypothetical protein